MERGPVPELRDHEGPQYRLAPGVVGPCVLCPAAFDLVDLALAFVQHGDRKRGLGHGGLQKLPQRRDCKPELKEPGQTGGAQQLGFGSLQHARKPGLKDGHPVIGRAPRSPDATRLAFYSGWFLLWWGCGLF